MADAPSALTQALQDRYTIEHEIGAGGMATVYLAEDLKHHRKVAVKVLRPDLAATLGPDRFVREVMIAAGLTHPHIVPVHDSGEAGGFLYYVMPFVEGESLRTKLVREGELPIPEAIRILRDLADAMSYAHQHGVVHRDIKPENVMVAGRHALVTDFGVAKAVSEATGRHMLTTAGVAIGTPTYMAPEQAAADPHIDHRADIYAFGAVAYELLAGRPPFVGATPQVVLAAHVTAAVDPVTRYRQSLPAALAAMVMKCLEKKPADRWQRADELVQQLEAVLTPSGEITPAGSRPVGAVRKLWSQRWTWFALAAVLAVGASVWRWTHQRVTAVTAGGAASASERRIAVMPFDNVGRDSATDWFADGITNELTAALGKVPGLRMPSRAQVYAYHDSVVNPKAVGASLGVQTLVLGTAQRAADRIRVTVQVVNVADGLSTWSDSYSRPLRDLNAAEDEIVRAIAGALKIALVPGQPALVPTGTPSTEAHELYLQGLYYAYKYTEQSNQRAIGLFQQALARDSNYAAAWVELADMYQNAATTLGIRPPKEVYPLARRAALKALELDSTSARARSEYAYVKWEYDWDFPESERQFRRALRFDPQDTFAHIMLALIFAKAGDHDSALAHARANVARNPVGVLEAVQLALIFSNSRLPDSAETWLRQASDLDANYAQLRANRLQLRVQQERWAQCLEESVGLTDPGYTFQAKALGAYCEAHLGKATDARRHLAELAAARGTRYVPADWLAMGYVGLGDRDAAFHWLDQALPDRADGLASLWVWYWDPIRSDPRFQVLEQRVAAAANTAP